MNKTFTFSNENHPEKKSDEIFLTNSYYRDINECEREVMDYSGIGWKTKRKGCVAYDTNGKILPSGIFPVFVKISEIKKGNKSVAKRSLSK